MVDKPHNQSGHVDILDRVSEQALAVWARATCPILEKTVERLHDRCEAGEMLWQDAAPFAAVLGALQDTDWETCRDARRALACLHASLRAWAQLSADRAGLRLGEGS